MKPIPQHEFTFAGDSFNLSTEATRDGERDAQERESLDQARAKARAAQQRLFAAAASQAYPAGRWLKPQTTPEV